LNHTSHVYATTKTRRSCGSKTVLVYSSDLVWASTSSLRYHSLASLSMVSQKLQRHISSPRSPTRRRHRLKPRSTRTSRFAGRTSTNFSTCRGTAWTHTISQCTSPRPSQKYDKLHGRPSARYEDVDFSSVKSSVAFPLSPPCMFIDGRRECRYKKHAYASTRLLQAAGIIPSFRLPNT
jgi:hypothetical protein